MREKGSERDIRIPQISFQQITKSLPNGYHRNGGINGKEKDDWTTVIGWRRRAKEREERIRVQKIHEKFINMYVLNFPDLWTEEPLKEILEKFVGKVANVTIPRKRAKNGKRFAFVRFERVRDEGELIRRVKGVWIGLHKLLANVARFNNPNKGGENSGTFTKLGRGGGALDKNVRLWKGPIKLNQVPRNGIGEKLIGQQVWRVRNKDEANESGNQQRVNEEGSKIDEKIENEKLAEEPRKKIIVHTIRNREVTGGTNEDTWAENCLVVETNDHLETIQVQNLLDNNGHKGFRVAKLTETRWILEHNDEESRKNLLEEEEDWMTQWFRMMKPWEKHDINGTRRVWISIYGVPLNGWARDTFVKLGKNVGKTIEVHKNTIEKKDFRKGRVLVETPMFEIIRKRSSVLIQGEFYPINLVEEWADELLLEHGQAASREKVKAANPSNFQQEDMSSGNSSEECFDEDSALEKNDMLEWETVPETPVHDRLEVDEKGEGEEGFEEMLNRKGYCEQQMEKET